jgi:hypothetical protein
MGAKWKMGQVPELSCFFPLEAEAEQAGTNGDVAPRDFQRATTRGGLFLLWLLSTPFAFNYGGAAVHPYWFLFLMGYWSVGLASAILLRKKGSWQRIVAAVWHSLLVGYTFVQGLNWDWESPNSRLFGFFAIYGIFAISYLATTAVTGLTRRD